jgi:hypothetical protein
MPNSSRKGKFGSTFSLSRGNKVTPGGKHACRWLEINQTYQCLHIIFVFPYGYMTFTAKGGQSICNSIVFHVLCVCFTKHHWCLCYTGLHVSHSKNWWGILLNRCTSFTVVTIEISCSTYVHVSYSTFDILCMFHTASLIVLGMETHNMHHFHFIAFSSGVHVCNKQQHLLFMLYMKICFKQHHWYIMFNRCTCFMQYQWHFIVEVSCFAGVHVSHKVSCPTDVLVLGSISAILCLCSCMCFTQCH